MAHIGRSLRVAALVIFITALSPPARAEATRHRGLYVTDGASAARDPVNARALLAVIAAGRFDQVVLYRLGPLLHDEHGVGQLAELFGKLRGAGVRSIGAPVADTERLQQLMDAERSDGRLRFDLLVTEYEYWNKCGATDDALSIRSDCFAPMQQLVSAMKLAAMGAGHAMKVGAYLGRPTAEEMKWLGGQLHFVFLDYPAHSPRELFDHNTPHCEAMVGRFAQAAAAGLEIWPILYARGEVPMKDWLDEHGLEATERAFLDRLARSPSANASARVGGFQYFGNEHLTRVRP